MTNSAVSQWEVAGSKKGKALESGEIKRITGIATRKTQLPSKIPVIETLQPIRLDNGMYDSLNIDDDEEKKPKTPKAEPKAAKVELKKVPVSPKAKKEEPINLLRANIEAKPKKIAKSQLSPSKSVKTELELALSRLDYDQFQQKYTHLEGSFPDNIGLVVIHMAAFLNQSLNDIPDLEPNQSHENESNNYPTCKLDKKLEKFFNNIVAKLQKAGFEYVFDYCLNEIVNNENPRVLSNHGLRIFIQILVKHNHNITLLSIRKTAELIYTNRHKHQRIMLALWALSQIGFFDLANGMTIWFEVMFPLINMKQFQTYISSYLQVLFEYHKLDTRSIASQYSKTYIISLYQYLKVYELSNDKSLNVFVNKENMSKFKFVFQMIRALFISNLEYSPEACLIFETLLTLTAETSPKQTEFLELLAHCLFSNTDCMDAWRVLYSKNVCQTMILIDYLLANYKSKFLSLKNMRETLVQFERETSSTITKNKSEQQPIEETTSKKPYYLQKKVQKTTNNLLELEKLNVLVKITLKKHFQRVSFFSIMFKAFFFFAFFSMAFYYWDATQNKSIYFKAGQKQLDKYGLLDDVTRVVDLGKKSYYDTQKAINYHVPIWYKKTSDVVLPYATSAWKTTTDYSKLAWKNSEDFRTNAAYYAEQAVATANDYFNQASTQAQIYFTYANDYVQKNFPVAKKTAIEYSDLFVKYSVQTGDATVKFMNQAVNYTGTELLGWKKGELELAISQLCKETNQVFQSFLQWVNKSIKNLHATMQ